MNDQDFRRETGELVKQFHLDLRRELEALGCTVGMTGTGAHTPGHVHRVNGTPVHINIERYRKYTGKRRLVMTLSLSLGGWPRKSYPAMKTPEGVLYFDAALFAKRIADRVASKQKADAEREELGRQVATLRDQVQAARQRLRAAHNLEGNWGTLRISTRHTLGVHFEDVTEAQADRLLAVARELGVAMS